MSCNQIEGNCALVEGNMAIDRSMGIREQGNKEGNYCA